MSLTCSSSSTLGARAHTQLPKCKTNLQLGHLCSLMASLCLHFRCLRSSNCTNFSIKPSVLCSQSNLPKQQLTNFSIPTTTSKIDTPSNHNLLRGNTSHDIVTCGSVDAEKVGTSFTAACKSITFPFLIKRVKGLAPSSFTRGALTLFQPHADFSNFSTTSA
jgi:hypothetical protein